MDDSGHLTGGKTPRGGGANVAEKPCPQDLAHVSMTRKRPTLTEVARLAGTSSVAVSLALRDPEPNGRRRVSTATRARIRAIATELDYFPNPTARNLVFSRTHQVGLYLNSPDSLNLSPTPWRKIISAIQTRLWARGYRLGIYYFESGQESGFREFLAPNRFVDGIIVQGRGLSPGEVRKILEAEMPAVSIYQKIQGLCSVTVDEQKMGSDAADYLREMGHRHVAVFALSFQKPEWNCRVSGFLERAAVLGIRVPAARQLIGPMGHREPGSLQLPEELYQRLRKVLGKVSAVYCPSDYLSTALVRRFDLEGIRLGRDVSLLSYDNLEGHGFKPWPEARLTTFDPPFSKIASQVVSILLDDVKPLSPTHHTFAPRLIERGSVARLSSNTNHNHTSHENSVHQQR